MDHQSLNNVLGILRLIKAHEAHGSASAIIQSSVGERLTDSAQLKVMAYMLEQVDGAQAVIENSNLSDEAKQGVKITLDGLSRAFSINTMNNSAPQQIGNITAAISNFVILLDVAGVNRNASIPDDAKTMVEEIEKLLGDFADTDIDPVVRDVANRHLKILSTLLQHIPVFGVEAAMATYFELVMKIRRADINTTDKSKSKLQPLWDKMQTWGTRLSNIDKIWNKGARLLGHAGKAKDFLTYLGG